MRLVRWSLSSGFQSGWLSSVLQFAGDVVEPVHQVRLAGASGGDLQPAVEVFGQHDGRRVVEDQRGRKGESRCGFEPVTQLDGGQRVKAEVLENAAGVDVCGVGAAQDGGGVAADQVHQLAVSLLGGQSMQPCDKARSTSRPPRCRFH